MYDIIAHEQPEHDMITTWPLDEPLMSQACDIKRRCVFAPAGSLYISLSPRAVARYPSWSLGARHAGLQSPV